jgi:RNA polymerase sigma-70 factor (ECF subfamily)
MAHEPESLEGELERHRAYLGIIARKHLDRRLWCHIDPSDVVQHTLLDAHRKREQFQGVNRLAWLRAMLLNDLADAIRKFGRVAQREKPIQTALDQSSGWINASLAADQSSPSQQAMMHEQLEALAQAVAQLPDGEREAVELHHLHGWTVVELAEHLRRTQPAVAGLLHRGLKRLRGLMRTQE